MSQVPNCFECAVLASLRGVTLLLTGAVWGRRPSRCLKALACGQGRTQTVFVICECYAAPDEMPMSVEPLPEQQLRRMWLGLKIVYTCLYGCSETCAFVVQERCFITTVARGSGDIFLSFTERLYILPNFKGLSLLFCSCYPSVGYARVMRECKLVL